MDTTEKDAEQTPPDNVAPKETVLVNDVSVIKPTLGGGEILGRYQGNTEDGTHAVFTDIKDGHEFHIPVFGQLIKAIEMLSVNGGSAIGKIIKIVVLDVGRYLIKQGIE